MTKVLKISIALIAWVALIIQFYLIIENRVTSISETTIRYFSYFTILTNLAVAIIFTKEIFKSSHASLITAITVYITVVGIVYQVLLRSLWKPTGMQKIADELLHSIIPVLVLIYWFFQKRKGLLKYRDILKWLIYPLIYLICILLRGKVSNFYPYSFVNVRELGLQKVLINSFFLLIGFMLLSTVFIKIGKTLLKKNNVLTR